MKREDEEDDLDAGLASVGLLASPVAVDRTGAATREQRIATMRRLKEERKREESAATKKLVKSGSETAKAAKAKTGFTPRRTRRRGKVTKVSSGLAIEDGFEDGVSFEGEEEEEEEEEEDSGESVSKLRSTYGTVVGEMLGGGADAIERFPWTVMLRAISERSLTPDEALLEALSSM